MNFPRENRALIKVVDSVPDDLLNSWLTAEHDRRHYRRLQINGIGAVKKHGTMEPCLVRDISPGGACVKFDGSEYLAVDDKIILHLDGPAHLVAEVRSALDDQLGLAFLHSNQGQQALAQWLTYEENTRHKQRRNYIVCPATLYVNEHPYRCTTQNVSLGGAKIESEEIAFLQLGTEIALEFGGMEAIRGSIRYKIQLSMGIKFNHTPNSLLTLTDWMN